MNIVVSTDTIASNTISGEKKKWKNFLKRLDRNPNLSREDKIRCMFNRKKKIIKHTTTTTTTSNANKSQSTEDPVEPTKIEPHVEEPPVEFTYDELRRSHLLSLTQAYK
jgi:murein L,D-transpeptidase YafK